MGETPAGTTSSTPEPQSPAEKLVTLEQRAVDEPRAIKVIVIGAGISGILAGIRLPQRIENLDLVIYEKNPEVGGTWYENRYPGVACDIPSHSYQASFEPNPSWSRFYAPGAEIGEYWKHVARKYGVYRYLQASRKVLEAKFDEARSKWTLKIQKLDTSEQEVFEDEADVLFGCIGALNEWKWPEIKGLHDFKGKLLHSANWEDGYEYAGKEVAVIGIGSSAIQIVPTMQKVVKKLDHYARGKTWIAMPIAGEFAEAKNPDGKDFNFSEADIEKFKNDPKHFYEYRRELEHELNSAHTITMRGSDLQKGAVEVFTENMKQKLASKPEVFKSLLPPFPPACRRLTPGPGYLEAIAKDNVNFISDEISYVTPDGLVAADGTARSVDAIICATGFDTTWTKRFPIIGRGGKPLSEKWKDHPDTYLSIATDGFPNYFMSLGPNSGVGTGSLTIVLEREVDYVCKAVQKIQRENIKTIEVKASSVRSFQKYCDAYFPGTVFSMKCRSWYKGGTYDGKVSALWPGSCLHAERVLSNPRWEDWEYEYMNDSEHGWLGNGWTMADVKPEADRAYYLKHGIVDLPPVVV
ncbi:hypothetical protein TWF191_004845 [Orbilia oligospora]|uniref:FAD/NAD(P)-binding domain-containing protein n=1 Tax=Orbilia oligospora TaxID=2813651 RepID=A0A7C8UU05_ORBOL|nr:hypothetical protein TWF679_010669 [Orbilia oligospora]KAF3226183.1 hypothetical protein TWF191_004845 [Orbilia oligospora]